MSPSKNLRGYVTFGLSLSLAGCMAGMPESDDSETQGQVAPLAIGPVCHSDADCRVVPDYCSDCSCIPLGAQQPAPQCLGEPLTCVLNPCAENVARCVDFHCVADANNLL